jgi:hypothetical protein
MSEPILMPFSRSDLVEIALALSAAASDAHFDERLPTAATNYDHAAMFYDACGYPCTAAERRRLAQACRDEWAAAKMETA